MKSPNWDLLEEPNGAKSFLRVRAKTVHTSSSLLLCDLVERISADALLVFGQLWKDPIQVSGSGFCLQWNFSRRRRCPAPLAPPHPHPPPTLAAICTISRQYLYVRVGSSKPSPQPLTRSICERLSRSLCSHVMGLNVILGNANRRCASGRLWNR